MNFFFRNEDLDGLIYIDAPNLEWTLILLTYI